MLIVTQAGDHVHAHLAKPDETQFHDGSLVDDWYSKSVDTGWIRDILKEQIGKLPPKVEPVGQVGCGKKLPGHIGECWLTRMHEPVDIHRGGHPKTSEAEERDNAIFVK
jgi:hypothetical protein